MDSTSKSHQLDNFTSVHKHDRKTFVMDTKTDRTEYFSGNLSQIYICTYQLGKKLLIYIRKYFLAEKKPQIDTLRVCCFEKKPQIDTEVEAKFQVSQALEIKSLDMVLDFYFLWNWMLLEVQTGTEILLSKLIQIWENENVVDSHILDSGRKGQRDLKQKKPRRKNVAMESIAKLKIFESHLKKQTCKTDRKAISLIDMARHTNSSTSQLFLLCEKCTYFSVISRTTLVQSTKYIESDIRICDCFNFILSSLVNNSKLTIFIPRFLDSCSFIVYLKHSQTDLFYIGLIFCDLVSNILLRLLMVDTKKHLFSFNLSDFFNSLRTLKVFNSSCIGYVRYCEKKSLTLFGKNKKNDESILKSEQCIYDDKVVELSRKPTENQVGIGNKQFYGDVNLQTQGFENDRVPLHRNEEQAVSSKDNKSEDDVLNSLKRTVRDITEMPDEKRQRHDHYIVAPVTKPKGRKKRRSPQTEDLQDSHPQPQGNHDSICNEGQSTSSYVSTKSRIDSSELDRAASVNDNSMPHINIDGANCLNPPSSVPLRNENVEKNTVEAQAFPDGVNEQPPNGFAYSCDLTSKEIDDFAIANSRANIMVKQVDTNIIAGNVSLQHLVKNEVKEPQEFRQPQIESRPQLDTSENGNSSLGVPVASDSNPTVQSPNGDNSNEERFEPLMNIIDKIADGERVPPQITMQYEMLRFCTLRSFPKENKPYISRIAAAGFYYANTGDEVVCYSCARRKSNWREDDDPMEIHRQLNPNCSYLLRNSEVNVPVKASVLSNNAAPSNGVCVSPTQRQNNAQTYASIDSTPNASNSVVTSSDSINVMQSSAGSPGLLNRTVETRALTQQHRAHGNFVSSNKNSALSIGNHSSANNQIDQQRSTITTVTSGSQNNDSASSNGTLPKYPKYASKPARLVSFNECGDIVIPPDSLATSGFFYAGFGDCVRCFHCGVGLRHWSDEDDPWIEHCRWSKDCVFVKQVKGQEFVNLVQMAVQYSQNQNTNGKNGTHIPAEPNSNAANRNSIENLMHTNAAQSVLEMGYHPDIIRRAIHAIKDANSEETLSAANLMEKIFELEDHDASENSDTTLNSVQNGVSSDQSYRTVPSSVSSNSRDESAVQRDNASAVQRDSASELRSDRGNSLLENQTTNSVTNSSVALVAGSETNRSSSSTNMNGSLYLRTTRKSQLLEQKKLQEENKQLKQQSLCIKCKTNDVCIVFLPCGHLVTCETCAPSIRYCSVDGCGKYIKGTVRTYLA